MAKFESRFFNARTGDVVLTCCHGCGAIVWNRALHERQCHGNQDSNQESTGQESGTGQTQASDLANGVSGTAAPAGGPISGPPGGAAKQARSARAGNRR